MPARVLNAALQHYRRQQRLVAVALAQARRSWSSGQFAGLLALLMFLKGEAAQSGYDSIAEMLTEQDIDAPQVAEPLLTPFQLYSAAGAPLANFLAGAKSEDDLEMLMLTEIHDAARQAMAVDIGNRPKVKGWTRYLNPPSCSRCAILAGRFYKYTSDFERHPNCDCFMVPVSSEVNAEEFFTDFEEAMDAGQIKDLTKAEREAIKDGANPFAVINVKRKQAGLRVAGKVLERGGHPTPEGIYALASDRTEAIDLMRRFGYLR